MAHMAHAQQHWWSDITMLLYYSCILIKSNHISHYLMISNKDDYFYYITPTRDLHWVSKAPLGFETQALT